MPQQSFLMWVFHSLGFFSVLLMLALMFSFAITLLLVWRVRGGWAIAGLMFVVPIPLWVGILGTILGYIQAYRVIAMSASAPDPAMLAHGLSTAMVSSYVGAVLVIPNFLLAVIGSVVRSSKSEPTEAFPQ